MPTRAGCIPPQVFFTNPHATRANPYILPHRGLSDTRCRPSPEDQAIAYNISSPSLPPKPHILTQHDPKHGGLRALCLRWTSQSPRPPRASPALMPDSDPQPTRAAPNFPPSPLCPELDTVRHWQYAIATKRSRGAREDVLEGMLLLCASDLLLARPGRCEPRAIKRPPNPINMLPSRAER
jgi:hypothetical protein